MRDDKTGEVFFDAYTAVLTTAPEAPTFDDLVGTTLRVEHQLPRRRWNPVVIAAAAAVITLLLVGLVPSLLSDDTEPVAPSLTEGWIAFEISTRASGEDEYSDIFVVGYGDDPVQISPRGTAGWDHVCPVFSPDGSRIAYGSRQDAERFVVVGEFDTRSGTLTDVTSYDVVGRPQSTCPQSWSPDGTKLSFLSGNPSLRDGMRGFVLDLETSDVVALPLNEPLSGLEWSPTTDLIALVGTDPGSDPNEVWLLRFGSDSAERIAETDARVTWSPDGSRLVLDHAETSRVITLDGTHMMDVPGVFASWSPNGEWIAYWSVDVTGGGDQPIGPLMVVSVLSGEVVELNTGAYGFPVFSWSGGFLTWTNDSRHVLAHAEGTLSNGESGELIIAASVDSTDPPRVLAEAGSFSGRFSWAGR